MRGAQVAPLAMNGLETACRPTRVENKILAVSNKSHILRQPSGHGRDSGTGGGCLLELFAQVMQQDGDLDLGGVQEPSTWKTLELSGVRGITLLASRTEAGDGYWCELWPKQCLACSTTGDETA